MRNEPLNPDDDRTYIQCENCETWFDQEYMGISEKEINAENY